MFFNQWNRSLEASSNDAITFSFFLSFTVEINIENIIASLEEASNGLFDWFKNNRLKSNVDNYHALVSTDKPGDIKIYNHIIDNSECEKLLRAKIDINFSFNSHISDLCKKASRKICT